MGWDDLREGSCEREREREKKGVQLTTEDIVALGSGWADGLLVFFYRGGLRGESQLRR